MPKTINQISDFYYAVVEGLKPHLHEAIKIENFFEFGEAAIHTHQLMVFVELAEINPAPPSPDGRHGQQVGVILHCFASQALPHANVKAMDLASAIERVLSNPNPWHLTPVVLPPEQVVCEPGFFKPGSQGFESWQIAFTQTVYLGEPDPVFFDHHYPEATNVRIQ
ncbi:hypothetical protein [Spartinivicinus ruber]|uniref:hypothetical protein n=1 Tax=Spartinivicinus ruber TaxID=2683272 RepID=UPI0013D3F786|nr:hypothetical protein [Spartinivicinus ruber]